LKQEQTYVHDEFGKLLERERISSNEHLTRAILRERAATEEERQKAQRFVSSETFIGVLDFFKQPCRQTCFKVLVEEETRSLLVIFFSLYC